ncbi:MAG: hypothetical protein R2856_30755 [Caldilineaceae bacterium]
MTHDTYADVSPQVMLAAPATPLRRGVASRRRQPPHHRHAGRRLLSHGEVMAAVRRTGHNVDGPGCDFRDAGGAGLCAHRGRGNGVDDAFVAWR